MHNDCLIWFMMVLLLSHCGEKKLKALLTQQPQKTSSIILELKKKSSAATNSNSCRPFKAGQLVKMLYYAACSPSKN